MKVLVLVIFLFACVQPHHFNCVFDHINQDLREQSQAALPDVSMVQPGSARQLLTITRNPIRITLDSSTFNTLTAGINGASTTTTTNLAFLLKTMQVAVNFYMTRLKVYPMSSLQAPSLCVDYNTPSNDQSLGISGSDLHIYVTYTTDMNASYGANGKSCKYLGNNASLPDSTLQIGRPTMGRIKYNTYNLIDTQSTLTNRLFQSITSTAIHEITHILGFDSSIYSGWLVSDQTSPLFGKAYAATTLSGSGIINANRPASSTFLITPSVTAWAQTYFNCPSLPGMLLENEDSTLGVGFGGGSHWERVAMYDELMTATAYGATKGYSALTFAVLKDMGWYTVDDTFNETSNYGYQNGCSFFKDACYNTSFNQFCNAAITPQLSLCGTSFFSKAICSNIASVMADGCGLYGPYFSCVDPDSVNDGYQSYTSQVYGTSSFCVVSTLGTVALPSTVMSRCYPYVCGVSSITFTVGANTIVCQSNEAGAQKVLNSFTGYLQCPIFSQFCTESRKTCPNWCSRNGYCMGGICNCMPGYYGSDCSKTTCTSGTYYSSLTGACVGTCPSNYYANKYNSACMKCSSVCQQCFGESTICTGCISSAVAPQYFYNNTCYSTCPPATFTSGFNCSLCDSASNCATCSLTASNCTSCSGGLFLSQPGWGTCLLSCPLSGTYSVTDLVNYECVNTCNQNLVLIAQGGINTCQNCPNSTFKFISLSSCMSSCPNFYYANNVTWICSGCDSSCLTCYGQYAQNCLSCSPVSTLSYLLLGMCWSFCPGGYYANKTIGACILCPVGLNCGNCSYFNLTNSVLCTSCSYGYYYQSISQTCLSSCNSSQFAFKGNNSCISCDSSCLTCGGPGSSFCSSCQSPNLFKSNVTGGYCISSCNSTGFYNSAGVLCMACDYSCTNCSGASASECTSCPSGTYLSSGECRFVCPPACYPNDGLNICSSCDGSCTFCFGPTINNCTGCISGMVLFNFTCTLSCPTGYTVNQWNVCFAPFLKWLFPVIIMWIALL